MSSSLRLVAVCLALLAVSFGAPRAFASATEADGRPQALERAVEALEAGRLTEAEAAARRLAAETGHADALDLLGVTLVRQRRAADAEQAFRQALERDPNHWGALGHLARVMMARGDESEVKNLLARAHGIAPLDLGLAKRLAMAHLSADEITAAVPVLQSITERFESVWALLQLARIDSRQGRAGEAKSRLEQGLHIAPNSERLLHTYAQVSMAAGTIVDAIRVLDPLVRLHPKVPEYSYLLGVARLQLGDLPAAAEILEQAVPLQEKPARALLAHGLALSGLKDYERASEVLARSLRAEPESLETMAALAEALEGLGESEQARRLASRVLEQGGDHATAHLVIGLLAMKAANYAAAAQSFEASVAAAPDQAKSHYQLSLAYARLGEREKSAAQLERYRRAQKATEQRQLQVQGQGRESQRPEP